MLADGEAEDGALGEREAVAASGVDSRVSVGALDGVDSTVRRAKRTRTDMAVLGERTILSMSLKRCHCFASRAGLVSACGGCRGESHCLAGSSVSEREGAHWAGAGGRRRRRGRGRGRLRG